MAPPSATMDSKLVELFRVINIHCSQPENAAALSHVPQYLAELVQQHPPHASAAFQNKVDTLFGVIRKHCASSDNVDVLGDIPCYLEELVAKNPPKIPDGYAGTEVMLDAEKLATLDVLAFPHLLDVIILHSDRPVLTVLARVSSMMRDVAIKALYPSVLTDPFPTAASGDATTPHVTTSSLANLDPKRVYRKLESFLSSPHLKRVQQIVITDPAAWAVALRKLKKKPAAAIRAPKTVTMIRFAPSAPGQAESVRWDAKGSVVPKQPSAFEEASDAASAGAGAYGDRFTEWQLLGHVLEIATLIPSTQFVLCVPGSTGADLSSIITHAALVYEPPKSMRRLSLVYGGGNIFGHRGMTPRNQLSWDSVELVLAPDMSSAWKYTYLPGQTRRAGDEDAVRGELHSCLTLPTLPLGPSACYSIVGLEGMEQARRDMAWYKEGLRRWARMHFQLMSARSGPAQMEFATLKEWKRGTGIGRALELV